MFDEIVTHLQRYAAGVRTRGGFSELELFIARLRQDQRFDPKDMIPVLTKLLALPEACDPQFAMGINLIVQKIACRSDELRDALERRVIDNGADLAPRSQFELAMAFIFAGGDWTPRMLRHLTKMRLTLPELWLDLAIVAYPLDVKGLAEAVIGLLTEVDIGMKWTALKPRYLKLVSATVTGKFNWFVQEVINSLPAEDRNEFISWINSKRGSNFQLVTVQSAASSAPIAVRKDDIAFLSDRPRLAKPIPIREMEAA